MKTRDGLSLEKVLRVVEELGFDIKSGTNHPYLIVSEGMIPCPVATSTDVKRMVVPWVRKATGYDPVMLYQSFKKGKVKYN